MTVFELWDTESANLVGTYETEVDALLDVRRAIIANGLAYGDGLALMLDDDGDEIQTIAIGSELAIRAQAASTGAVVGAPS